MSKKPVLLAVVAVLAAGAGYAAYTKYNAGAFTVSAAGAPVRTGPVTSTEQKLCAEKGKTIFEASGYSDSPLREFTAVYGAYYNARLGHCYLAITSTYIENQSTMVELFDADDKKLYGMYNLLPADAPGAPPKIVACTMAAPGGGEKPCTTPAEWTAFISGYMN